jgi:multiple sugar transport system permease protein
MAVAQNQLNRPSSRSSAGFLGKLLGTKTKFQTQRAIWGYIFALPWVLGLVIFWLGPIFTSFYYSFTNFEVIGSADWLGLANYERAFTSDDLFWASLGRTFTFVLFYVPVAIIGALLLATMLNQKLIGTNIYRTIFFMPHLIPAVALAVVWIFLLQPRLGPINYMLREIGVANPPDWLASRGSALYTVIMINAWAAVGGNTMLIFLAGLQGVPQELYEAAEIDGAGAVRKFWNVTLPLLTPTIFFNMVLAIISALNVFTTAWVATKGGPSYATWFFALHIYTEAFQYFRLGYGSALAWVLAVIIMFFTWIQVQGSKRWVHYEGN